MNGSSRPATSGRAQNHRLFLAARRRRHDDRRTLIALVLNERFAGRGLLRSVVLVPWAMAPVSVGVLWSFIYAGDLGLLNGLLNDLGMGRWRGPGSATAFAPSISWLSRKSGIRRRSPR